MSRPQEISRLLEVTDGRAVLKEVDVGDKNIQLIKRVSMSYFTPKGKARLGTETSYSVQVEPDNNINGRVEYSRYHMKKPEATKYFNQLKKELKAKE